VVPEVIKTRANEHSAYVLICLGVTEEAITEASKAPGAFVNFNRETEYYSLDGILADKRRILAHGFLRSGILELFDVDAFLSE